MDRLHALREEHLVETDWLEAHLGDLTIRIVDMRGSVKLETLPDGSQRAEYLGARAEYDAGHIPGAIYLDWTRDIVDMDDPVPVQVMPISRAAEIFSAAGIGPETMVIAYDSHNACQFATRLWWVLRYFGHDRARVLNGGWRKWLTEGRPATTEPPVVAPTAFTPRVRPELRVAAEEVLRLIGDPSAELIDARDAGQYTGAVRRGPRGGRIPGALHLPRERLFAADGTFLPPDALAQTASSAGITTERRAVAYCNGGVAATSVLFALSMLGYPNLANYDGSWNEWTARQELPVERDPGP